MSEGTQEQWQQPELSKQAEVLKEISRNMLFSSIRGKLKGNFLDVGCKPLYDEEGQLKSGTLGKQDTRNFLDAFFWVQSKIGQLERTDMRLAAQEVRYALLDPHYLMLGETDPLSSTIPVTLVMFEAKLILPLLVAPLHKNHMQKKDIPRWIRRGFVAKHIYKDWKGWTDLSWDYIGSAVERILRENYWLRFEKQAPELWQRRRYCSRWQLVPMPRDREEKKGESKWILAGIAQIFQASKEEVAQLLSPEERSRAAFWEFNLQKDMLSTSRIFQLGLHLAEEHPYWIEKRGPLCSINVTFGRGAVFNAGEAYHCFDRQSEKFKGTRLV